MAKAVAENNIRIDVAGSGDGTLHAWNINTVQEVGTSFLNFDYGVCFVGLVSYPVADCLLE